MSGCSSCGRSVILHGADAVPPASPPAPPPKSSEDLYRENLAEEKQHRTIMLAFAAITTTVTVLAFVSARKR